MTGDRLNVEVDSDKRTGASDLGYGSSNKKIPNSLLT